MATRKDSKGRKLREGESQRQDGRYCYTYVGLDGKRHTTYSWKLDVHDVMPSGKHTDVSLREKERQIEQDMLNGVMPCGGNYTVVSLLETFLSLKTNIKPRTREIYESIINVVKNDSFGDVRIDKVTKMSAKMFFIHLQDDKGYSYNTLKVYHTNIKSAFAMAVEEDLIRKNPLDFVVSKVLRDDTKKVEALSREQQNSFLEFVEEYYPKYYDAVYLLFSTGMRIGEFSGLTIKDIDLKNGVVNVNQQIYYSHGKYSVGTLKTTSGQRSIPMTDKMHAAFSRLVKEARQRTVQPVVDGYSGFLFCSEKGMPAYGQLWQKRLDIMNRRFNKYHPNNQIRITPHVCRHTFITLMALSGMNPKILQTIAGHADIKMTLGYYTHVGVEDMKKEFLRLAVI